MNVIIMTKLELLSSQFSILKTRMTHQEWIVFCLAYYEKLSINEICFVMDLDSIMINRIIDSCLYKAIDVLGDNMIYLTI